MQYIRYIFLFMPHVQITKRCIGDTINPFVHVRERSMAYHYDGYLSIHVFELSEILINLIFTV